MPALKDELGDLLLQVVFHARIAEEGGLFAFNDVVKAIKNFTGNPADLYHTLLAKLTHNKKRFYEFASEQKKLFNL